MNRKAFQFAVGLMWLALPLTALQFMSVWDRLPARMASHFDVNWRANGWMARETSFWFAVGLVAFLLMVFTVVSYAARATHAPEKFSWALLGFSYLVIAFTYSLNGKVIAYNLTGETPSLGNLMTLIPFAIIGLVIAYVYSNRGVALPVAPQLAEEVHNSPAISLLLLSAAVPPALMFYLVPDTGLRIALFVATFVVGGSAFAAWDGFHYIFTHRGLEIRTLGFRLRSIPADQIQSFASAPWSIFRGFGIRGVGNHRAYVWGTRGVRVETAQGQIFLGHNDPQRILHDLSAIKQLAH